MTNSFVYGMLFGIAGTIVFLYYRDQKKWNSALSTASAVVNEKEINVIEID